MDDIRNRFLRDRVLTATPVQRVVMLYDRLALDIARARAAGPDEPPGPHLGHAAQVVAELLGSLDHTVGGLAENLASIYHYLLRELLAAQTTGATATLPAVADIVGRLRETWSEVAQMSGGTEGSGVGGGALVGAAGWTA